MIGVGDLVVCVDAAPLTWGAITNLREGKIYRVSGLDVVRDCPDGYVGEAALWLDGVPPTTCGNGRLARRFRKVQHDKREACETEFVTLLNRAKVKEPQA